MRQHTRQTHTSSQVGFGQGGFHGGIQEGFRGSGVWVLGFGFFLEEGGGGTSSSWVPQTQGPWEGEERGGGTCRLASPGGGRRREGRATNHSTPLKLDKNKVKSEMGSGRANSKEVVKIGQIAGVRALYLIYRCLRQAKTENEGLRMRARLSRRTVQEDPAC